MTDASDKLYMMVNVISCTSSKKIQLKELRALRGYFGAIWGQKLKVAFHQIFLIGL